MKKRESKCLVWLWWIVALGVSARAAAQPSGAPIGEMAIEAEVEAAIEADAATEVDEGTEPAAATDSTPTTPGESVQGEPEPTEADAPWWNRGGLHVGGYIQIQLVTSQLSHDEIGPDGSPLNQDRFVVRRGRLRVDRAWQYASVGLEIDASTTRGPFVGIRRAEASFFHPNGDGVELPPWAMVTVGLTSVPFGHELEVSNRDRWFLERSTGSLAFQRGEPDVGVRLSGGAGPFRYAFAVMNGNPLDDRPGGEPIDLTGAKDVVGRVGIEAGRENRFELRGGVSFHVGRGLHEGSPATKPTLLWSDENQNGVVDLNPINEITFIAASAATPSIAFDRWGLNADVGIGVHSPIGWTRVSAEITLGSNLDRSLYLADPIAAGANVRELAWYAAVLQDVTAYGIVGFRVDRYDPNSDFFDERRGRFIPTDASILTLSPLVGAQLRGRGRIVLQYDHIRDHLGRDAAGVPTDLRNDQFVARLQMEL